MALHTAVRPHSARRMPFSQISVTQAGRTLASAAVTSSDRHRVVVKVHIEAGHLPMEARALVVDSIIAAALHHDVRVIDLVVPTGDVVLDYLKDRCTIASARTAGSTCLVRAILDEQLLVDPVDVTWS